MGQNHYEPAIKEWKSRLITARARRMGFRSHDLLDAQQKVSLAVTRFRYDSAKSNGATEATALTAMIDRQLGTMLRAKARYECYLQRAGEQGGVVGTDPVYDVQHGLIIDVRDAVGRLTPVEQAICQSLSYGDSIDQIARDLGRGWNTIRRTIEHIRAQFSAIGLDAWLVRG